MSTIISELNRVQAEQGCLSDDTLQDIAKRLNVPLYRLEGLVSFYPHFRKDPPKSVTVELCRDVSCHLNGGAAFCDAVEKALDGADAEVHRTSCLGRCELAPACTVNGVPLDGSSVEQVVELAKNPEQLPADDPTDSPRGWKSDPYDAADSRFGLFRKTVEAGDSAVDPLIATLKDSGLRGMGGAGFPTGLKWELVRKEQEKTKFVVCNADESEPGTFKDRVILEEAPWLTLEGMMLAGYSIQAQKGILYIRHEYIRERKAFQRAIDTARAAGLLGENILGSGWSYDVEIFVSPGGYILGEETALLEALEDKRGEPRNKPPYPGSHGLHGKPTLINNVETFAMVPAIGSNGADWWKEQGAGEYAGLKFVSVSGHVSEPGVFEIPVGTTVNEVIEMAGGVSEGRALKGFIPGGASAPFLPASAADTPMDFNALQDAGSTLGSGALVVAAEGTDMIEMAANVVRFFRNESCGKCVPCRVGSEKTVNILDDILAGRGKREQLELLEDLSETLLLTSICGLGQVVLNPIQSALTHFPQDLETHLGSGPA